MAPLIRAVLSKLIGNEEASKIEIISNDVQIETNGHWEIKYRHPERSVVNPYYCSPACPTARPLAYTDTGASGFGHDKSQAIIPYRSLNPAPTLFFFGDGVSGNV
jgi:2-hydroxy-3-keto-5-methylthiopentenyl-1-phosphate phosphatase